jgi:four helix bundle protein
MTESFKNLEVWKISIELAVDIYEITEEFPEKDMYGITSQIRRASVSISNNISEGSGLDSQNGYLKHLRIANGSLCEVKNLTIIAKKIGYIDDKTSDNIEEKANKVGRLLNGFINFLKKNN